MPVSAERVSARASTLGSSASTLPGIVVGHLVEAAGVDQRRRPPHRERGAGAALGAAAAPALAQQRNHRAARGELHGPDRDPAQPAHARRDVVADLTGAGRDQPAQDVADRRGERVGRDPARAAGPARGGSTPTSAHRRRRASPHLVAVGGRLAAAPAPRHDASRLPRDLQLDHAGPAPAVVGRRGCALGPSRRGRVRSTGSRLASIR